ncbi:TadE/TadG family type IV pilus assembly protein [Streptomyces sp. NPDC049967]|uniref:TadE/TadG family type IV pilus assembly protein n=1 Tax=unclassified Streptomyces TaxID=2593676 RepID=UPI002E108E1F|nr:MULTISPECIES: TadE/TadG family type IV pilus assembly protein [unclassified Streptomyces]WSJ24908.1 pilus assembly protein [Streptomyces sp. NBC_01324]
MNGNRRGSRRERGQVAIEYLGFIPLLLLVGLCAIQLGIAAYTVNQAGTAARVAARTAGQDDPAGSPEQAGASAISGWLADGLSWGSSSGTDEVTYTAHVEIPSIVPGLDLGQATRSSTMPRD